MRPPLPGWEIWLRVNCENLFFFAIQHVAYMIVRGCTLAILKLVLYGDRIKIQSVSPLFFILWVFWEAKVANRKASLRFLPKWYNKPLRRDLCLAVDYRRLLMPMMTLLIDLIYKERQMSISVSWWKYTATHRSSTFKTELRRRVGPSALEHTWWKQIKHLFWKVNNQFIISSY